MPRSMPYAANVSERQRQLSTSLSINTPSQSKIMRSGLIIACSRFRSEHIPILWAITPFLYRCRAFRADCLKIKPRLRIFGTRGTASSGGTASSVYKDAVSNGKSRQAIRSVDFWISPSKKPSAPNRQTWRFSTECKSPLCARARRLGGRNEAAALYSLAAARGELHFVFE